jgi:phage-related protein
MAGTVEAFKLVGKIMLDGAKKAQEELGTIGEKAQRAGKKMQDIGKGMSTKFTAPVVAGVGLAVKSTEEFRGSIANLETNARDTGTGVDFINGKLDELSGISTDNKANVEGLSNLMRTGFDEEGMSSAVDALSGAVVAFPDTLKFEGLADGLQETMATGKAVGPFAEMLERSGVNVDKFSDGLAKAKENGEAQNFILNTLADTGLAKTNEKFRENNSELVKNREANQKFQRALSGLAKVFLPIITMLTEKLTQAFNWFNGLSDTTQKWLLGIVGVVAAIGPLLLILGTMITSVTQVIGVIKMLRNAQILLNLAMYANPIMLVVASIVTLIAIGVLLYKNWDTIKAKLGQAWDWLKGKWGAFVGWFMDKVDTIKGNTARRFAEIKSAIIDPIRDAWNTVKGWLDNLKNAFDFNWSIPSPGIPSVSVSMRENSWGIPYPDFDISWHKKGGWFDGAQLLGAGEAGREALIPTENKRYMAPFSQAIAENLNELKGDKAVGQALTLSVPLIVNGKEIARAISKDVDQALEERRRKQARNRGITL